MIPTGGLSVFIHIIIILLAAAIRPFPAIRSRISEIPIPAGVIGAVLLAVMLFFASRLLLSALNDDNNFDHLSFLLNQCEEQEYERGERNIIIRIDDIQAYAWTDTSRRMISDSLENRVPLSLGVIPIGLRDDYAFYEFLRTNRCQLEYAVHGWDNQEPEPTVGEFARLDKDEARERLEKAIATIDRLSRRDIVTFVPPLNQMSPGSLEALDELKFRIISSEGSAEYDYDTTTFDFVIDELVTIERIQNECEGVFEAGEAACVVMVHPQDFHTDGEFDQSKYQLFLDVIAWGKKEEYSFVRFIDMLPKQEEGLFEKIGL